jgi:2-isopropylmalate synthase
VEHTAASGNGPVHALDQALRRALGKFYPSLGEVYLVDYKVRVISGTLSGTASLVRVLITSSDGKATWGTVGVSANIVEASWRALVDSVEYKLMKDGAKARTEACASGAPSGEALLHRHARLKN